MVLAVKQAPDDAAAMGQEVNEWVEHMHDQARLFGHEPGFLNGTSEGLGKGRGCLVRGAPAHTTSPISVLIDERIERPSIEHAGESGECRCISGETDDFPPLPTHLRNKNYRSIPAFQETMTHS
jgi:hypothetical protein